MPLSPFKKLGLCDPMTTTMRLMMVNQTVKRSIGILHDLLVKVDKFIFPADFVILICEVDFKVPLILESPSIATGRALVDMKKEQKKFW